MSKATSKAPHLTRGVKEFTEALAAKNDPPLYTLSYDEARQVLLKTQSGQVKKPEAVSEDLELPVGPTGRTMVRMIRPPHQRGRLPLVVYFHGWGWVMGNRETHDRLARTLAVGAGAAVALVDYRPSPESQFPAPVEEAYAVVTNLADNADQYALDAGRLILAGDSAGGNMAIAAGLLAGQRGGRR